MKNNIYKIILLLIFFLTSLNATGQEQFNFSVTEIDILENGNKFIGSDRGVITSNDGIEINADKFEYNKKKSAIQIYSTIFASSISSSVYQTSIPLSYTPKSIHFFM